MKIKIERPDIDSAKQIFTQYLMTSLPIAEAAKLKKAGSDPEGAVRTMIDAGVDAMYSMGDENKFLGVTYQNGDRVDAVLRWTSRSGALIENIVRRAKKLRSNAS